VIPQHHVPPRPVMPDSRAYQKGFINLNVDYLRPGDTILIEAPGREICQALIISVLPKEGGYYTVVNFLRDDGQLFNDVYHRSRGVLVSGGDESC